MPPIEKVLSSVTIRSISDAAVDRRAQFGEFDIELSLAHGRFVIVDGGLRVVEGLRALLEDLIGDGLIAYQLLAARIVGFGEGEIGLGLRQIGARLSSVFWNGRLSMVNNRSPCLTICPSVKCTPSR